MTTKSKKKIPFYKLTAAERSTLVDALMQQYEDDLDRLVELYLESLKINKLKSMLRELYELDNEEG